MERRQFIEHSAMLAALGGIEPLLAAGGEPAFPGGKAQACILLWLGGGPAQVDTFDPKPLGDPATKKAGSAYPAIDTFVPGVQLCEHLPELAKRMDRATVLRTVSHDVIDEHAAAVNFMHTGRPVSGTVVYPSIGSVISHELICGLDQALSALMDDLEAHGLLETTLICVAGEFGRPSGFDGGGGRGHQGSVFSVLMAGGGLKHKGAIGVTDEASKVPLERPISVLDWHSTIYHALGINYQRDLFDGDRLVPITDHGTPIRELFV